MGCSQSSHPVGDGSSRCSSVSGNTIRVDSSQATCRKIVNQLSPKIRLDHSSDMKNLVVDGSRYDLSMRYCYVSQRGYYPNDLEKANQDSYLICESLMNDHSCHVFGIFDGHGEFGDLCSHFSAENFPIYLEKEFSKNGGSSCLEGNQMEIVYTRAFMKTNKALHKSDIDDSLSGTTGVTIIVKGDILYVANVGDSRAIIASDIDGKVKYSPLSSDQTPFRKDERERLKRKGAKIMTLDQIEGVEPIHENWGAESGDEIDEVGDPPRVWDQSLERPGCAFTRSIGDAVAETVGVFAEPEILVWKLTPSDRFAIIASDGVFEFLTSQAVVDIISKMKDPLEAAKRVVDESYRLWLTYDDRTDDITLVVIVFDDIIRKEGVNLNPNVSSYTAHRKADNMRNSPAIIAESRPVRRVATKEKRRDISELWDDDDEDFDSSKWTFPKTPEEVSRLTEMLNSNFMFQSLQVSQLQQICSYMKYRTVTALEMIIQEGEKGTEMYIVDSGKFDVLKKNDKGDIQVVFSYQSPGAAFGELSLMYGKPRAASVRAKTAGGVWVISRQAFRAVMMKRSKNGILKSFQTIPLFQSLTIPQLQRLCQASFESDFRDEDIILTNSSHQKSISSPTGYLPSPTTCNWIVAIVLSGSVKLWPKEIKESSNSKTKEAPSSVGASKASSSSNIDPNENIPSENISSKSNNGTHSREKVDNEDLGTNTDEDSIHFRNVPHITTTPSTVIHHRIKPQIRTVNSFIAANEVGAFFDRIEADGPVKLLMIPKDSFQMIAGDEAMDKLLEIIVTKKSKGKMLPPPLSVLETVLEANSSTSTASASAAASASASASAGAVTKTTEEISVSSTSTTPNNHHRSHGPGPVVSPLVANTLLHLPPSEFTLQNAVSVTSNLAYLGTFRHQNQGSSPTQLGLRSGIMIALQRSISNKMASRWISERDFLWGLTGLSTCLPSLLSSSHDDRVGLLIFSEVFVCDMAVALSNHAIPETSRSFYAACIFAAVDTLHQHGVIHRMVALDSFYITDSGIPKLVEMRYAKLMDGRRCYTICGLPLYFAPEIISNRGYDYGADLWAVGASIYEMYEGILPWGSSETEETLLYRTISMFKKEGIMFTSKTPRVARDVISNFLNPSLENRLGYNSHYEVMDCQLFAGLSWSSLGLGRSYHIDVHAAVDSSLLFNPDQLEPVSSSTVFQNF